MSKRWNDIESTLKGGLVNSTKNNNKIGKSGKKDVARKLPMSGMKKLTSTQ